MQQILIIYLYHIIIRYTFNVTQYTILALYQSIILIINAKHMNILCTSYNIYILYYKL